MIQMRKFIKGIKFTGYCMFGLYFISMFVYPFYEHQLSWSAVQSVWSHWQTLNVGALAFLSSVILYNATKYHSESQRQRSFIASRAFLPEAFSELLDYLKESSNVLRGAWLLSGRVGGNNKPSLPTDYKNIFRDCISHASPNFGDYLARFLVNLQIHDDRLGSLLEGTGHRILSKTELVIYMYRLAELVVYINKAFQYARGASDFDNSPFTVDDFRTAYLNMGINVQEFDNLWASTEQLIQTYHSSN